MDRTVILSSCSTQYFLLRHCFRTTDRRCNNHNQITAHDYKRTIQVMLSEVVCMGCKKADKS
jgi:hypothetical protein